MPSGPAAMRVLTRLNVLLTLATENESPQFLVVGRVSRTVLSSKRAKKVFSLSRKQDVSVRDVSGFPVIVCRPCHIRLMSEPLK
jgi:hypothetical protein